MARKARPTLLQSNIATSLLVCLSVLLSPITLLITLILYILTAATGTSIASSAASRPGQRTILITGARANKALALLRAFKREGHRVVLAEEAKWGALTCARFSRATDVYYPLPDPHTAPEAYIDALKAIVAHERIDAWVPCSSVHATMVDSEAARQIRLERIGGVHGCECFIPEPEVCGTLHWKDQFEELCVELGYPVPDSKKITSVSDAVTFLHSPQTLAKGHRYLLKALTLDDLGRDDFTLLPLRTRDETFRHLSTVPMPPTEKDPFLLQQFLFGAEYCTHVAARDGRVVAFVACRSNQLLMRYADVRGLNEKEREIGIELEKWTVRFLQLYRDKLQREGKTGPEYELTGHFSFDFIVEGETIYVLECNVRAHTAVVLFSDVPDLASHYLTDALLSADGTARPAVPTAPRSWFAHALPLTLATILPRAICDKLHPQLYATAWPDSNEVDPTASPLPGEGPLHLLWRYASGAERDGVWDWTDPVPFFVLCHIQWPWLLLRLMWRGVAWSRVNVSTSRLFEC